jgi:hypothetical protein
LVDLHARCCRRVERRQAGVQGRGAAALELGLERRPQRWVGAGEAQVVERRPQVEPRPADEHRHDAAREQVVDDLPAQRLVRRRRRGDRHRPDVEQVVRTPPRSCGGSLAGADVHAAVELHGVGVDDLAAHRAGERDPEVGLAGRRRPDDGEDPRAQRGRPT